MARCGTDGCPAPAVVLYVARGGRPITYRARLACTTHRAPARTWTRLAGPVTETHLNAPAPARDTPAAHPTLF